MEEVIHPDILSPEYKEQTSEDELATSEVIAVSDPTTVDEAADDTKLTFVVDGDEDSVTNDVCVTYTVEKPELPKFVDKICVVLVEV